MATQRARSDDAKRARRIDIVAAARDVFDASETDEFTMDAVAVKLGLAKGTLYRYFPTREGLLLDLASAEYADWFERVDARLRTLRATGARPMPDAIASGFVDELVVVPRFMRLASLVPSVLERNVPFATAFAYKTAVITRSQTTTQLVADVLEIEPAAARRLLLQLQAVAIGLYHMAHPAPIIAEVLADPTFPGSRIDERAELQAAVRALVVAATQSF